MSVGHRDGVVVPGTVPLCVAADGLPRRQLAARRTLRKSRVFISLATRIVYIPRLF